MLKIRTLAAGLAATVLDGCSDGAAPLPQPSAVPAAEVATSATPTATGPATAGAAARLAVPAVIPGELVRAVVTLKGGVSSAHTTLRRRPVTRRSYSVQAACAAATPGRTLGYQVTDAEGDVRSDGRLGCDGSLAVDEIGPLPRGPVQLCIVGDRSDITSAYAILAPSDAVPAQ